VTLCWRPFARSFRQRHSTIHPAATQIQDDAGQRQNLPVTNARKIRRQSRRYSEIVFADGVSRSSSPEHMVQEMARFYFYYSTMNAGKSTTLLQSSYNYKERGMNPLLLTPQLDYRFGEGQVASRIGLHAAAVTFNHGDSLLDLIAAAHKAEPIDCVLVDEA
jgi:hypothetical protein